MGWEDRDYNREPEAREVLRSDFVRATLARGLASAILLVPLGALASLAGSMGPDWAGGGSSAAIALGAGALAALLLAAAAALGAFVELWLEARPMVGIDRSFTTAGLVFVATAILLYAALPQVEYPLLVWLGESPLATLERKAHLSLPADFRLIEWLRLPATLFALAAPSGIAVAVRAEDESDDGRPLAREALIVGGLSAGAALLMGIVIRLGSGAVIAYAFDWRMIAARLALAFTLGVAAVIAGRLSDQLEERGKRWLEGDRA